GQQYHWQIFGAKQYQALLGQTADRTCHHIDLFDLCDDFWMRMREADLLISQAGYNACVEIIYAQANALLVPFENAKPDENEQKTRALAMQKAGLAGLFFYQPQAFDETNIIEVADTKKLILAIEKTIDIKRSKKHINMQGAEIVAKRINEILSSP
ncbi:MAG: glycosyltransferase, partial [Pseudomonadota bacterium]